LTVCCASRYVKRPRCVRWGSLTSEQECAIWEEDIDTGGLPRTGYNWACHYIYFVLQIDKPDSRWDVWIRKGTFHEHVLNSSLLYEWWYNSMLTCSWSPSQSHPAVLPFTSFS
jgi:hypothetical protein